MARFVLFECAFNETAVNADRISFVEPYTTGLKERAPECVITFEAGHDIIVKGTMLDVLSKLNNS